MLEQISTAHGYALSGSAEMMGGRGSCGTLATRLEEETRMDERATRHKRMPEIFAKDNRPHTLIARQNLRTMKVPLKTRFVRVAGITYNLRLPLDINALLDAGYYVVRKLPT